MLLPAGPWCFPRATKHVEEKDSGIMAPLTINSTVKLPSGHEIPRLGFGVRQTVCQVATAPLC